MSIFSLASLANPHGILLAAGIGFLASAATVAPATYYVTHAVMKNSYDDLVIADQKAQAIAVALGIANQKNGDAIDRDRAVKEAIAQQHLQDLRNQIPQEVTRYVNNKIPCISVGLVRVLDAHALGLSPAELPLASGQSNDTCSAIDNATLAASVAGNYTTALQNGEQLGALIDAIEKPPAKAPTWWERNSPF